MFIKLPNSLENQIGQRTSTAKSGRIVIKVKNKQKGQQLPLKVQNSSDFAMESEDDAYFAQSQQVSATYIINLPFRNSLFLKQENKICEKLFEYFTSSCSNFEYSKRILVVRDPNIKDPENQSSFNKYNSFFKELHKLVYQDIYHKKENPSFKAMHLEESDLLNADENDAIYLDMLNFDLMKLIISLSEAMDRITDDEITNCIVLSSYSFYSPINWFLSPAALGLSYFNYQLSLLTKPHKDEKYYSKTSLPRVTYLSLTGIYSEIDLDVLLAFTDNIQIIVLYDESTGPAFTRKGEYEPGSTLKEKSVNFQQLSSKILFIPMKCDRKDGKKSYNPNDILTIMENLVFPSIEKFKPSNIVMNTSFSFDEQNSTPYFINGSTMGTIISFLKILCDGKILVFPFKLPNMSDERVKEIYDKGMSLIPDNQQSNYSSILKKYGIPYDELNFRDCFGNIFESLADIKELLPPSERTKLRKIYRVNPPVNEVCYRIARAYKEHPYYSCLYSKTMGCLATIAQKEAKFPANIEDRLTNTISIYCPDNDVRIIKLSIMNGNDIKEFVLDKNSQYYIDYDEDENPALYVFNAKLCEISNELRTYSVSSHFRIILEIEETIKHYFVNDEFVQLNPTNGFVRLKNSGLCKVEDYIFQVYGTDMITNQDSDAILCYNFKNEEYFQLKIEKSNKPEIMKRQGVTSVVFKLHDTYYLYVFGGKVQANTMYKGKAYGVLDIIDIVEVYETKNIKDEWKVTVLPKHSYQNQKQVQFIPYHGSFAHYFQSTNKILIMGGKTFDGSITNWTFPVFEFNVLTNTFTNYWIFLNDVKNNTSRKAIQNHDYNRPYIPEAISDYSKNLFFEKKNNTFKFVIQNNEFDIVSVYSYNPEKQVSDIFAIQVEKDSIFVSRVIPPNLNKENTSKGFENKYEVYETRSTMSISYAVKTLEEHKALLSVDNWRLLQKKAVLSDEQLENYLESIIEANKSFLEEYRNNKKDDFILERKQVFDLDNPIKRIQAFENILQLVKAQKLNELLKKDSRIEVMRTYLITNILSNPSFRKSRTKFNEDLKKDYYIHLEYFPLETIAEEIDERPSNNFKLFWKNMGDRKEPILAIINSSKNMLEDWIIKRAENGDDNEVKLHRFNFVPLIENEEKEKALGELINKIQEILDTLSSNQDSSFSNTTTTSNSTRASTMDSGSTSYNLGDKTQLVSVFLTNLKSLFTIYRFQLENTRQLGAIYVRPNEDSIKQAIQILIEVVKSGNEEILKYKENEETKFSDEIYAKKETDDQTIKKEIIKKPGNNLDDLNTKKPLTPKFSPAEIENQETIRKGIKKIEQDETIRKSVISKQPEIEEVKETFEEAPLDLVSNFKDAIKKPNDYRLIFNKSRSELNVIFSDSKGQFTHKRLRFKIPLRNKRTNQIDFEDISFESCPNSVSLFNSAIVCYVEQSLKSRYIDIYNNYKSWIFYANIEEAIQFLKMNNSDCEFLIFRKLFKVAQDEHIFSRSLLLTEESLFLFGGKSVSFKRKYTVRLHSEISRYIFSKFNDINQISSDFRDPEVDPFEKLKGEIVSIYHGDKIFIVEKTNPQNIEIFNKDGSLDEHVEFEATYDSRQYFVKLNFVNFRDKDEILLILYSQDQNMMFRLFDINTQKFEERKVNIVFQNTEEQQDKLKQIYTGFEEFEITTGIKGNQDLLLFSTRGDDPSCSLYKISVET